MKRLLTEFHELAQACAGVVVSARESVGGIDRIELGIDGGEAIEVAVGPESIRLDFAGWSEHFQWTRGGGGKRGGDEQEAAELALDFVAAALSGELRVIELRAAREAPILRRELEVCVAGTWRRHAKFGALGLTGTIATVLGRTKRRVRSNEGRLCRPQALGDAGPSGLRSAPWAGAAGSKLAGRALEVAIDGELDLHNFSPKEVAPLVREYIEVCRARGIHDLRIVHGKGKGVLRRTVHSLLAKHEAVESYRLGSHGEGSWGATIVRLR